MCAPLARTRNAERHHQYKTLHSKHHMDFSPAQTTNNRTLYIANVGPIKEAKLSLKRFNFFIGPQSCGKSTIAKIVSSLSWLEKEACVTLSTKVLPVGVSFKQFVEDFHRMHGYINEEKSVIEYESDFVSISYKSGKFSLNFKEECENYKRVKVSYIPSDRNVVTMKDIEKRELEPTNFRSFLFDWLECHKHYDAAHKTDILNLGIKYYCDDTTKGKVDRVIHKNGSTYEIPLYDASSGLQSAVPMIVLVEYLATQYADIYEKELSFDAMSKKSDLLIKLLNTKFAELHNYPGKNLASKVKALIDSGDEDAYKKMNGIMESYTLLTKPQGISFIIEEPEQNLFPQTQVDVLKTLVRCCKQSDISTAVITTHSPYIVNYLNILINKPQDQSDSIKSEELNVFLITEGLMQNLMTYDVTQEKWYVDAEALSEAMNQMSNEYQLLSSCEKP